MSAAFQLVPAMKQMQSPDVESLTQIFDPRVNMALWQRPADPAIAAYSEWLLLEGPGAAPSFSQIQLVATPTELAEILPQRLPDAPGKTEFVADLLLVSQMLTCLMDCSAVGFRLKALPQAMCPRFHTDHVALRLLITYLGQGTQWLDRHPAEAGPVHQMLPQQVALLKGSAWPENQQGAVWHRSPAAPLRLLLSLDPVE